MILPNDNAFIGERQQEEQAIALLLPQIKVTLKMIAHKKRAEKLMADELFYMLDKVEQKKIIRIASNDPEGEFLEIMKIIKPILGEDGLKNVLDVIGPDNEFIPLIKKSWD